MFAENESLYVSNIIVHNKICLWEQNLMRHIVAIIIFRQFCSQKLKSKKHWLQWLWIAIVCFIS